MLPTLRIVCALQAGRIKVYTFYFKGIAGKEGFKLVALKAVDGHAGLLGAVYTEKEVAQVFDCGHRIVILPDYPAVDSRKMTMRYAKGYRGPAAPVKLSAKEQIIEAALDAGLKYPADLFSPLRVKDSDESVYRQFKDHCAEQTLAPKALEDFLLPELLVSESQKLQEELEPLPGTMLDPRSSPVFERSGGEGLGQVFTYKSTKWTRFKNLFRRKAFRAGF